MILIRIFLSAWLLITLFAGMSTAQDKYDVIRGWRQYSDAPNAWYHDMAAEAYDLLDKRIQNISQLRSLSDWQRRQREVKDKWRALAGPFPEKTPLHAQIVRKIQKDGYRIENIVFQSRPGFYVTSSLFIPDGLSGRGPAIIDCIGHSEHSYRTPMYQHEIINLVRKGFIVLAFDPVGQGERLQYFDPQTGKSRIGGSTQEHSYEGVQAFITGSSQANYEIWDGIRAVDYVLTRKEVDPSRIGITGISGGGTQTAYIAALDDRIRAAAPENYITSFRRLIQAIGPQDAEQNLVGEIASGIDHADFLEVRAPKPTLMIATTRDFFPIQGSRESAKEIAGIFRAYDKGSDFRVVEDDTTHAFSKKNCEAMYAFFQKYLDNPGDSTDEDVEVLGDELRVTATGQVSTSFKDAETVFSLNKKEAEKRIRGLQDSRKDLTTHLPRVLREAKKLSGYREPGPYHAPVFTGRYRLGSYAIEKYFVQGAGGYVIPYLLMVPDSGNGKAVICLNGEGKSAEMSNGDAEFFVRQGYTVLAPDLPGAGELGHGDYTGDSFIDNTSYGVWYLSILIGRSIVGIRAADVTRLVQLLKQDYRMGEVYGLGRGTMSTVMLYAAAFDPGIKRICLIDGLSSYRSLVMNRFYDRRFTYDAVAGALTAYDLPDLAASLAPRRLMIIEGTDKMNKYPGNDLQQDDISFIRAAYAHHSAQDMLLIGQDKAGEPDAVLLSQWIK